MMGSAMSRRRLLQSAAGLAVGSGALALAGKNALAAAPKALDVTTRTIEVNGRAATVFALLDAAGKRGLAFVQGEPFYVRLGNRLTVPTLIHWHGLTPPSQQDGVPILSQAPIPGGGSYVYDFRLTESGTYWMHSHDGLDQTQKLMSAPLIIRSPQEQKRDEQEVVVMLNDFTFKDPMEILAGLQGRAQAAKPPGEPAGEAKGAGMSGMPMGSMNMGPMNIGGKGAGSMNMGASGGMAGMPGMARMDVNDIDFDAYLANERTLADPEVVSVERGGRVRLRLINGADSTNFFIDLGALEGELIAVDGHPIVPVRGRIFPAAMAQRLDIRLRLPAGGGAFPVLARREGDVEQTGIVLASKGAKVARIADKAGKKAGIVGLALEQRLRSKDPLPPRRADRTLEAVLGGDMKKYLWTINGAGYGKNKPLMVGLGERVEIVMQNATAMSHPMHLHGTVFQVVAINGRRFNGARRDTVMVPPKDTVTFAFEADNFGRWAFHCHNGYHMEAGMMTSVDYLGA
ncbi:MAG TPA: multicopper oxidase domain-containing protein [Stellaceae bacterium]|nr:multicopper oxidase domain-containing protein [Stellaceae bacterium]